MRRIAITLTAVLLPLFSGALALDPPPEMVELYMNIKKIQAAFIAPGTATSMPSTAAVERPEFYKGNEIGAMYELLLDYFLSYYDNYDCMEWEFAGICYRCDIYDGCEFEEYKSYYYPVQTFELSSKALVASLVPKPFFEIAGYAELEDYWYDTAKEETPAEMERVAEVIQGETSGYAEYDFQLPDEYRSEDIRNGNSTEQMEWRVVSTLAQQNYGSFFVPGDACHSHANTSVPYFSEAPYVIELTRLGSLIDFLFWPVMEFHRLTFGGLIPNSGIGTSLLLGLSPHTWLSPELVSLIPSPFSTAHLGSDYGGTHMSGNEYSKKWLSAMLRTVNYRFMLPGIFPIQKYSMGRKRSKFQWHYPRKSSCDLHYPLHPFDSYGSFLNLGYRPGIEREGEGRAVITQWHWFRCCPGGFQVLEGDEPQYKY